MKKLIFMFSQAVELPLCWILHSFYRDNLGSRHEHCVVETRHRNRVHIINYKLITYFIYSQTVEFPLRWILHSFYGNDLGSRHVHCVVETRHHNRVVGAVLVNRIYFKVLRMREKRALVLNRMMI